jgi:hypothetical protein
MVCVTAVGKQVRGHFDRLRVPTQPDSDFGQISIYIARVSAARMRAAPAQAPKSAGEGLPPRRCLGERHAPPCNLARREGDLAREPGIPLGGRRCSVDCGPPVPSTAALALPCAHAGPSRAEATRGGSDKGRFLRAEAWRPRDRGGRGGREGSAGARVVERSLKQQCSGAPAMLLRSQTEARGPPGCRGPMPISILQCSLGQGRAGTVHAADIQRILQATGIKVAPRLRVMCFPSTALAGIPLHACGCGHARAGLCLFVRMAGGRAGARRRGACADCAGRGRACLVACASCGTPYHRDPAARGHAGGRGF